VIAHSFGSRWKPNGPTSHLNPSPAHSLHRVGDATQGWDPVADGGRSFQVNAPPNEEWYSCPCIGLACLAFPPLDREGGELRLHPD
jgi:hypothetical protein